MFPWWGCFIGVPRRNSMRRLVSLLWENALDATWSSACGDLFPRWRQKFVGSFGHVLDAMPIVVVVAYWPINGWYWLVQSCGTASGIFWEEGGQRDVNSSPLKFKCPHLRQVLLVHIDLNGLLRLGLPCDVWYWFSFENIDGIWVLLKDNHDDTYDEKREYGVCGELVNGLLCSQSF